MDPSTDLNTLKNNAYTASQNVSNLTADAPSLLGQLKQNLVGIFAKNPILQDRNTALSDYLATPNNTRAELLNMPSINGRPVTMSPTQQDAIVSSRNAAAFAPLAGLNEIIKGQYGTIGDLVGNAGSIYDSTIKGAQQNASNLLDLYKTAISEMQARASVANAGGFDLPSILAELRKSQGVDTSNIPSLDSIFGSTTQSKPAGSLDVYNGLDTNIPNQGFNIDSLLNSLSGVGSQIGNVIQHNPLTDAYNSYLNLFRNAPHPFAKK